MKPEDKIPVFPVVIFPKKIKDIVVQTSEESNYPLNYIAAALFFAASVAVGNFRTLMAGTIKVKAILFMALIGSPGSGKTHPINFAVAPFLKLDKTSIQWYQSKLEEWRKAPPESRGGEAQGETVPSPGYHDGGYHQDPRTNEARHLRLCG